MSDEKITAPDMNTNSTKIDNRRSFLKKGGLTGVLGLTVASRPALGAVCNISGFASINPSGVISTAGCGGFSHGAWKKPYAGGGDGNLLDWHSAGAKFMTNYGGSGYNGGSNGEFYPNPGSGSKYSSTETATMFADIFGTGGGTLHDAVNSNGTLISEAAKTFLNACYFGWGIGGNTGNIHPADVIGLYNAGAGQSYTTVSGSSITVPTDALLKAFFENTQH